MNYKKRGDVNMTNKIAVLFILFVFYSLTIPLLLKAEDGLEGSIEIGGALTDLDSKSFKYGEYTGVNDDSVYFAGDVDLSYNRNAFFLDFRTDNIGLDNRSLYLETGRYGRYKLFLEYDEIPKLISNNSQTILNGAGSNTLTLPSGWTRYSQTTTAGMSNQLTNNKKDVELRTDRKAYSAGIASSFSNFDFKISFKKEEKEGTKSIGGVIGTNGGTTRSVVLPEPVDYTTDELKAALAYSGETFQIELGYYLSQFANGNKSLTWENPYNMATWTTTGYSGSLDDPATALISLPPDNQHQRFSLTGGINLPFASRLSFIGEYGIMEQDDALSPWSNNSATTYAYSSSLPRGTADAEIDTTHLGLNLSSKPLPKLGLNLKYKYYETKNKTPREAWFYVNNDTGGSAQPADNTYAEVLYNLPYDYTQNLLKLDASYYLFNGTTLKLGYDYDIIERDYREVNRTIENTYRARLNSNLSSFAAAGINLAYGERRIFGHYDEAALYDAYHTEAYINTVAANVQFDNHPNLRKFDIANRDRTRYGANITLFPHHTTTLGLYSSFTKDDYEGSLMGLKYSKNNTYTVDATYAPLDIISTYAYYTRDEIDSQQAGRAYDGAASKASQSTDPTRDWWADHSDNVDTVGIGTSIGFMENRLTIGVDYSYSESTSNIKFKTGGSTALGASGTVEDLPDLKTKLQTVNTSAKYKLTKNTTVGLGYQYENYKSDDWATDSVDPASTILANVLTLSGSVPDYEAHQAMLTVAYNW